MELFGDSNKVTEMAKLDVGIHISCVSIKPNKILDILQRHRHTKGGSGEMTQAFEEKLMDRAMAETGEIEIRELEIGQDGCAFRTLNEEWISRDFVLEEKDRETLGDPENAILRKGGRIFMVYAKDTAVGCVALIPMGDLVDGVFELSKMAVAPAMRGQGIGRKLLLHTISEAKKLGARSLFLGSSTKLENAVHLYESIGFRHVAPENLPEMHYARADVFMEMPL